MARRNLVAEVMEERCVYGGLIATRLEVYRELEALRDRNGERLSSLAVDRLTWMPKTATPEDIANRPTLTTLRAVESGAVLTD